MKTWTFRARRQFIAAIGGGHELSAVVFGTPVFRKRRGREAAIFCDLLTVIALVISSALDTVA